MNYNPGYAPQQQIVYQQIVRAPSNGIAVAAMILGIVAIVLGVWIPVPILGFAMMFLSFVPALLAVILGHIGLRNSRSRGVGRGGALAGLSLGYVTLGLSVVTTAVWVMVAAAGASSGSGPS